MISMCVCEYASKSGKGWNRPMLTQKNGPGSMGKSLPLRDGDVRGNGKT